MMRKPENRKRMENMREIAESVAMKKMECIVEMKIRYKKMLQRLRPSKTKPFPWLPLTATAIGASK